MESDTKRNIIYLLVGVLLIGLLVVVKIVPRSFVRSERSPRNACINNLRLLDSARQQWATENDKAAADIPSWMEIKPYIGRENDDSLKRMYCPEDKSKMFSNSYSLGNSTVLPRCKINPQHVLPR
jgi:hypothetical protein